VKAFVSRTEERFRPAYGRSEITYPRHCVFAGTTNKSDYLRDETGNRRFWPVKCGEIDQDGLRAFRESLLRAAVAAFKAGEKWWLEGEAEEIAREQQESRLSVDEWHGIVEAHVGSMKDVSITDIATMALGLDKARIGRMEQNRISAILTQLGYVRNGRFTGGEFKSQSRFTREDLLRGDTPEF
jgi:predicted P-loop ATPase